MIRKLENNTFLYLMVSIAMGMVSVCAMQLSLWLAAVIGLVTVIFIGLTPFLIKVARSKDSSLWGDSIWLLSAIYLAGFPLQGLSSFGPNPYTCIFVGVLCIVFTDVALWLRKQIDMQRITMQRFVSRELRLDYWQGFVFLFWTGYDVIEAGAIVSTYHVVIVVLTIIGMVRQFHVKY